MTDRTETEIWAVKTGPVIVGGVREHQPESPLFRLVAWLITVVLVAIAVSPFLGVVAILVAAMILAVKTAPAEKKETHP
jgi:hypothetical protein